VNLPLVKKIY